MPLELSGEGLVEEGFFEFFEGAKLLLISIEQSFKLRFNIVYNFNNFRMLCLARICNFALLQNPVMTRISKRLDPNPSQIMIKNFGIKKVFVASIFTPSAPSTKSKSTYFNIFV